MLRQHVCVWTFSKLCEVMQDQVFCCGQDKLVAAVCHGPAALTEAELNGEPLVKGKKVTATYGSCQQICPFQGTYCSPVLSCI